MGSGALVALPVVAGVGVVGVVVVVVLSFEGGVRMTVVVVVTVVVVDLGEFVFVAIAGREAIGVAQLFGDDAGLCRDGLRGESVSVSMSHLTLRTSLRMSLRSPARSPVILVISFHSFLFFASAPISLYVSSGGRSMNRFPSEPRSCCTAVARLTSRAPGSRRRCPSHFIRLFLMALTRS